MNLYNQTLAVLFALPMVACSSPPQPHCPDPAPAPPSTHVAPTAQTAHKPPPAQQQTPSGQGFEIAASVSDQAVHPQVLHDDANLKIAVVTIKPGATMAEHAAPVPVTVQTISGQGGMTIAGAAKVLKPGTIFLLDAGAPHGLQAAGEAPLVVLLHYLKSGATLDHHGHGE